MIAIRGLLILVAFVIASRTSAAQGSERQTTRERYAHLDSVAAAARGRGDWALYRANALAIDSIANGHPRVLLALARGAAKVGDTESAFENLRPFAEMGVSANLADDTTFSGLKAYAQWNDIVTRIAATTLPIGDPTPVFSLSPKDFIAEDISWDERNQRFLVTSIRYKKVVSVTRDGRARDLFTFRGRGTMLAVTTDPQRNRLWLTTYVVPQMVGYVPNDSSPATILQMDLTTGKLMRTYSLPADGQREPGDIAVARNGDLFISDGRHGDLLVIRNNSPSIETLVSAGEFFSPQGIAVSSDQRRLYVADYSRGIAEVAPSTGSVTWLPHPRNVAVNGIDGLALIDGAHLIAVQNGVAPNRLMVIALDVPAHRITGARIIARTPGVIREPTHGAVIRNEFWFIANGGFTEFGTGASPSASLTAPVIMKVRLKQ